MGFLNFLAKFSFIGYGFNERRRGKDIAARQYVHVMQEKEEMEREIDDKLTPLGRELSQEIKSHKLTFSSHPKVNGVEGFLDDRGLSPSQLRAKQLDVLKTVAKYDKLLDTEIAHLDASLSVREDWCKRLECSVVVKKKKVGRKTTDDICRALGDVDANDLFNKVNKGGTLKETYEFNDAQIIVEALAAHKISARAVSVKAQDDVKRDSIARDPARDIPNVAKHQRFALAVLFLVIVAIYVGAMTIVDTFHYEAVLLGVAIVVVIFFAHWLLTKPIIALATRLVEMIFRKGGNDTKDSATFLRGIFLSDLFEKGVDALDNGILDYLDGMQENYKAYRNWALSFLQARVLDGLLYEVINQMTTGATYNVAVNVADAKIDIKKAAKIEAERADIMLHGISRKDIEEQKRARRRSDYEKQRSANLAAAEQAKRDLENKAKSK